MAGGAAAPAAPAAPADAAVKAARPLPPRTVYTDDGTPILSMQPEQTLDELIAEYKGTNATAMTVKAKLGALKASYESYRRVRGDGNCYYRAVAVSFLEHCVRTSDAQALTAFTKRLSEAPDAADSAFVLDWLRGLATSMNQCATDEAFAELRRSVPQHFITDTAFDAHIIMLMRALTAKFILDNESTEVNGIDYATIAMAEGRSLHALVGAIVLVMGEDAQHLVLHALPLACGVSVRCVYLDSVTVGSSSIVDYPPVEPDTIPQAHILLKPGHFDVLYPLASALLKKK